MTATEGLTQAEILTQPKAWRDTLDRCRAAAPGLADLWRRERPDTVIFTGCGSTYYAGMFAAAAMRQIMGVDARAFPASDLLLYPGQCLPPRGKVMMVAISRSGSTSETVRACRDFLASGRGPLLTISGYDDEPMGTMGDLPLLVPAAQERSVVQTRAFTALSIAALAVVAAFSGDDSLVADLDLLPAACDRSLDHDLPKAAAIGRRAIDRVFILGSGPHFAIACEAALKTKEVTLTPAEPFHIPEFRHGPKSLVTPDSLVIGLLSGEHDAMERPVLREMAELGGQVVTFAPSDADFAYDPDHRIGELARALLPLPAIQWMATERALAQGYDPDRPRNLTQVITLDLG